MITRKRGDTLAKRMQQAELTRDRLRDAVQLLRLHPRPLVVYHEQPKPFVRPTALDQAIAAFQRTGLPMTLRDLSHATGMSKHTLADAMGRAVLAGDRVRIVHGGRRGSNRNPTTYQLIDIGALAA